MTISNRQPYIVISRLEGDYGYLSDDIKELQLKVIGFKVDSQDSAEDAVTLLRLVRSAYENVETARKAEKSPFLEAGRMLDGWFQTLTADLGPAEKNLKTQLAAWMAAERERKYDHFEEVESSSKVQTDYGNTAYIRKTWDFEVIDHTEIPPQYLMVNKDAVKASIKAGVRDIPGLRIFQKETVSTR